MDDDGAPRPVIWMRDPSPRRGPRPTHTRQEIAQVAMSIADEHGLDAVSIRAVAKELGAGAASLYRYIDSKADLYDLMVDAATAEFSLPNAPSGDQRADLTTIGNRARSVYQRHPWAITLSSNASWGPHVQAYMEYFLAVLKPTGLNARQQLELIAHFNASVATFAAHERQQTDRPGNPEALQARMMHLKQIAENPKLPHLSTAVATMLTSTPEDTDPDELFRRSLNRLIDTIPAQTDS
ncbi:TetR/AcrR family transcriptional regulator [Nocardia sp. NPDC056000]|uniref:TetR/AcrR family transcriptional regulator n=1 Tax=Nocardia sp. NPDC056000 TaxID=3345674 RepID=UPI0035E06C62